MDIEQKMDKEQKVTDELKDKSVLHYLALQHSQSGLSFEESLLSYLTPKDIGKLDIAISEAPLRKGFHNCLPSYYNKTKVNSIDELKLIVNRRLSLEKFTAPMISVGQ